MNQDSTYELMGIGEQANFPEDDSGPKMAEKDPHNPEKTGPGPVGEKEPAKPIIEVRRSCSMMLMLRMLSRRGRRQNEDIWTSGRTSPQSGGIDTEGCRGTSPPWRWSEGSAAVVE